jgi:acetyltransferase-like isoleucine patch superfamily enzyme
LVIGPGAYIGPHAVIVAYEPVTIGANALLGERVSIHSEDHGPAGRRNEFRTGPIHIGDDVWLGAGVVVTRNTRVGDRSTVGANAVVTRDIPADCLATGAPARSIRALDNS